LSQIAAEAAFEGRAEMDAIKHGYEENRRILVEGLPKVGLEKFLPVDGAFYLYADVSRFSSDSFDFARRMLEEAHVAATPGVDFDPIEGRHFIRFCYAGSAAEMHEAVERIGRWLRSGQASAPLRPIPHCAVTCTITTGVWSGKSHLTPFRHQRAAS